MSAATARLKEFDMQWFLYAVATWLISGALSAVAAVGKPRQPLTGSVAVAMVVINGAIAAGLVLAAARVSHA